MIFILHDKSTYLSEIYHNSEIIPSSGDICQNIWKLSAKFPDQILIWVEKDFYPSLQIDKLEQCFEHDLVMSSYSVRTKFLDRKIGFVDQLPFINVESGVRYPSWQMSSDIGGIKASTLLKFHDLFGTITNFDFLINSVAKVGQQNGLFCYSDPELIDKAQEKNLKSTAGNKELFSFVFQHYKSIWIFILFFCLVKYEKGFPLRSLFQSLLKPKFFQKEINLSEIIIVRDKTSQSLSTVDVIIPTLGRADYLKQVVKDLSLQSLKPERIIIVEQQPKENLISEIQDFLAKEWPFKIVHIFTHKTGACMARNKALEKVEAEWIFFADDDIRLEKSLLADTIKEAERLRVNCINLNCKQPGEKTVFHKVKQWGSFGAGTSMVKSSFAKQCHFSDVFEYGFGEDADFGMQLRNIGCDIIYHPKLQTFHLKAPTGGFRKKPMLPWEHQRILPKPAPTLMAYALKHYTPEQIKGYKVSLFLKFYTKQSIKNPFRYLEEMRNRWELSEKWGKRLLSQKQ